MGIVHGHRQDFSKGGHTVVLIGLSPEYCRLYAYKLTKGGGGTGISRTPLATPLLFNAWPLSLFSIISGWLTNKRRNPQQFFV